MEVRIDENLMFPNDELAKSVWKSKYAQDNETHYDQMHKRLTKEFAKIEWDYRESEGKKDIANLSEYGKKLYKKIQKATPKDVSDHIYNLFKDFKYIIPQGSIMSNLGNKAVTSLSNCLAGSTKVLTRDGFIPIYLLKDKEVEIMTLGGGWVKAPFKSYGVQKLYKLGLSKGKTNKKEILCTIDHAWYVHKKHKSPIRTSLSELKVGDKLHSQFGKGRNGYVLSSVGIAHGISYGDGHTVKGENNCNNITLCSDSRVLGKYFPDSYVSSDENLCAGGSDYYTGLPNYFRELPSIRENKSYLYGFLAGWFAADGNIDERGSLAIHSVNVNDIKFLQNLCGVLGIGCGEIQQQTVISNLTNRPHVMYKAFLHSNHLSDDFFLLEKHKNRFKLTDKSMSKWKVDFITEYGKSEEVFCAEVPNTYSFVIEGNILSGNCFVIGQPSDSYGGILRKDEQMAQLMKRRGGVGLDISTLRPATTKVSNAAKSSTGAVSFMHRFSNTTREVAQDGRRGALMLSIDINHPDVMDFIKIKRDLSQVTGANISIKLNNEFMKAVENDEDYILRFPCNTEVLPVSLFTHEEYDKLITNTEEDNDGGRYRYYKKIKAKEYWDEIIKSAHNVAEPGLMFWDNMVGYSPDGAYEQFKAITTNPCFGYETKILTAYGYERIGDLEGQDIDFINKDGEVVSGTVFKSGEKATYTLTLSNKETIVTTIDHRFMLTDGSEKQAQYLSKEDRLMPFFILNDKLNEFVKYGFIQGDGCTGRLNSPNHLGIEVNIGEKDGDIANLFNIKDIGKNYLGGFNEILKELGFSSSSLPNRTLPKSFNDWSSENKLMFLKGLWSANGSIIKGHRISFKSTCKELIIELTKVLKEFEIDSYFTTNRAKEVKFSNGIYLCKESYDLNISKYNSILNFAEKISFVHNYKQDSLKELILLKAPKVLSAKNTEVRPVYDFTLNDNTHWGVIQGVIAHNCSEIGMQEYDACRLIAVNLFSFVDNPFTPEAKFDFEKFYQINYEAMRLSDNLIDLELEHIDRILRKIAEDPEPFEDKRTEFELWTKIKDTAAASRRTGLGFTALGDTLAALGLKYDGDKALDIIDKIMKTKMESELDCTIDLAILRGSFEGWDFLREYGAVNNGTERPELPSNSFYRFLQQSYPEQAIRMGKYGRRNVSWSTVAPTGTVSIMTQTTSGIEPLFMPYYMRRKKINPNDVTARVDFVDQNGDKWQEFPVLHPKFKEWVIIQLQNSKSFDDNPLLKGTNKTYEQCSKWVESLTKDALELYFKSSPWYGSTANDIDWIKRVQIQSTIQKYITHSISSTINLPSDVSEEEVSRIYLESWKQGLKGITVYRDGSRSGVLVSTDTKKKEEFEYHDAPKRPKELDGEVHLISVKGVSYKVVIGLFDNKPYEIFIDESENKISGKGIILKKARGNYFFKKNDITTDITSNMSDEEAAITRLVSTSLRHGANIKFIVEQLLKCEGDLFSFTKSLSRVLKKYIPDGEKSTVTCYDCGSENVIFQEGCMTCQDCGSSKCG